MLGLSSLSPLLFFFYISSARQHGGSLGPRYRLVVRSLYAVYRLHSTYIYIYIYVSCSIIEIRLCTKTEAVILYIAIFPLLARQAVRTYAQSTKRLCRLPGALISALLFVGAHRQISLLFLHMPVGQPERCERLFFFSYVFSEWLRCSLFQFTTAVHWVKCFNSKLHYGMRNIMTCTKTFTCRSNERAVPGIFALSRKRKRKLCRLLIVDSLYRDACFVCRTKTLSLLSVSFFLTSRYEAGTFLKWLASCTCNIDSMQGDKNPSNKRCEKKDHAVTLCTGAHPLACQAKLILE